jgi:hypothetical protein
LIHYREAQNKIHHAEAKELQALILRKEAELADTCKHKLKMEVNASTLEELVGQLLGLNDALVNKLSGTQTTEKSFSQQSRRQAQSAISLASEITSSSLVTTQEDICEIIRKLHCLNDVKMLPSQADHLVQLHAMYSDVVGQLLQHVPVFLFVGVGDNDFEGSPTTRSPNGDMNGFIAKTRNNKSIRASKESSSDNESTAVKSVERKSNSARVDQTSKQSHASLKPQPVMSQRKPDEAKPKQKPRINMGLVELSLPPAPAPATAVPGTNSKDAKSSHEHMHSRRNQLESDLRALNTRYFELLESSKTVGKNPTEVSRREAELVNIIQAIKKIKAELR